MLGPHKVGRQAGRPPATLLRIKTSTRPQPTRPADTPAAAPPARPHGRVEAPRERGRLGWWISALPLHRFHLGLDPKTRFVRRPPSKPSVDVRDQPSLH